MKRKLHKIRKSSRVGGDQSPSRIRKTKRDPGTFDSFADAMEYAKKKRFTKVKPPSMVKGGYRIDALTATGTPRTLRVNAPKESETE